MVIPVKNAVDKINIKKLMIRTKRKKNTNQNHVNEEPVNRRYDARRNTEGIAETENTMIGVRTRKINLKRAMSDRPTLCDSPVYLIVHQQINLYINKYGDHPLMTLFIKNPSTNLVIFHEEPLDNTV